MVIEEYTVESFNLALKEYQDELNNAIYQMENTSEEGLGHWFYKIKRILVKFFQKIADIFVNYNDHYVSEIGKMIEKLNACRNIKIKAKVDLTDRTGPLVTVMKGLFDGMDGLYTPKEAIHLTKNFCEGGLNICYSDVNNVLDLVNMLESMVKTLADMVNTKNKKNYAENYLEIVTTNKTMRNNKFAMSFDEIPKMFTKYLQAKKAEVEKGGLKAIRSHTSPNGSYLIFEPKICAFKNLKSDFDLEKFVKEDIDIETFLKDLVVVDAKVYYLGKEYKPHFDSKSIKLNNGVLIMGDNEKNILIDSLTKALGNAVKEFQSIKTTVTKINNLIKLMDDVDFERISSKNVRRTFTDAFTTEGKERLFEITNRLTEMVLIGNLYQLLEAARVRTQTVAVTSLHFIKSALDVSKSIEALIHLSKE